MRKMKKINGYLVVKFNDREKRLNADTGLGSFGVIDAEQYTGILDIDRDAMEYDSADTIEEAIEQARGLESELDTEEPPVKFTIVTETDTGSTEEEVDPVSLFRRESNLIRNQASNPGWPYINETTAAYHLRGYVSALEDLSIADQGDERFRIDMEVLDGKTLTLLPKQEDLKNVPSIPLKSAYHKEQDYAEIADNIFENSALKHVQPLAQDDTLSQAEAALWKYFELDLCVGEDYQQRLAAYQTLQALIEKERNAPVGTGLERLTELAKGLYSGYIVFTPIKLSKRKIRGEFFHTIRREIIGSIIFGLEDGYFRIHSMAFDTF